VSFHTTLAELRQEQRRTKYLILAKAYLDVEAKTPKFASDERGARIQNAGNSLLTSIEEAAKQVNEKTVDECAAWTTKAKKFVEECNAPPKGPRKSSEVKI
jgi:hypothetical protein